MNDNRLVLEIKRHHIRDTSLIEIRVQGTNGCLATIVPIPSVEGTGFRIYSRYITMSESEVPGRPYDDLTHWTFKTKPQ